ncbi:serine/threonine protein kinase [Verrucomicrobiota bacterium]
MTNTADFQDLVPNVLLDAVEKATGRRMAGLATPLPSYVNRVYEIQAHDGERLITKFYRPGRWSREAIQEEHDFVADCEADEIPVVAPLKFPDGSTLQEADGIYFTIFPKRLGRQLELNSAKDWLRVGRLLGRVHVAGSKREARARVNLYPMKSTVTHIKHIVDGGFVSPRFLGEFKDVTSRILGEIQDMFDDVDFIRIHGDCHCGNLLNRPGEGLMVIDFDDMMCGPPVQDFWLLLPDRTDKCRRELRLLLRGYEMFREFDDHTLRLIEPLRTMRIIYYLAWCSIQVDDFKFRSDHPEWGSEAFWQREIVDLETQFDAIRQTTTSSLDQ